MILLSLVTLAEFVTYFFVWPFNVLYSTLNGTIVLPTMIRNLRIAVAFAVLAYIAAAVLLYLGHRWMIAIPIVVYVAATAAQILEYTSSFNEENRVRQ